jgi:hypothetical protein
MAKYDYYTGKVPSYEKYRAERDKEKSGEKVNHGVIAAYEAHMMKEAERAKSKNWLSKAGDAVKKSVSRLLKKKKTYTPQKKTELVYKERLKKLQKEGKAKPLFPEKK